jgi:hypothetical protein
MNFPSTECLFLVIDRSCSCESYAGMNGDLEEKEDIFFDDRRKIYGLTCSCRLIIWTGTRGGCAVCGQGRTYV